MYRSAYLAGSWYPENERECRSAIEGHASETQPEQASWRALIGPHAGWFYSGAAAARSYRWLAEAQRDVDIVVIFGAHRGPRAAHTIFVEEGWRTPLGDLVTHRPLVDAFREVRALDEEPARPPSPDNAVEVHLPFIRFFFPRAELVVVGVAASVGSLEVGASLGRLCRESEGNTVFVGSTDLTHYGPSYGFTPAGTGEEAVRWTREHNDRRFIDCLLRDEPEEALAHARNEQSACCPGAALAAAEAARSYGDAGKRQLVAHYLSYDVQPGASFVGYAGVVL